MVSRVYDRADFDLLGNLVELEPPPNDVAMSSSATFRITGPVDLDEPAKVLRTAAYARVADELFSQKQRLSVGDHGDLAMMLQLDGPVRRTARGLCSTYKMAGAVRGELSSCLPDARLDHGGLRSHLGEAHAFGAVAWAEGVMPFARAERLALRRAGVLHAGPVEERVQHWTYRFDEGYWLFDVLGVSRGGTWLGPDKFVDRVLVRVSDAGAACIVTVQPHSNSKVFDLHNGEWSCR